MSTQITNHELPEAVAYLGRELIARVETRIMSFVVSSNGCASRALAAQLLLDAQPGWYWQTPEGEYLTYVAKGTETRRDP